MASSMMNWFLNKMKEDEKYDDEFLMEEQWNMCKIDEMEDDISVEKLFDEQNMYDAFLLIELDGENYLFDEFVESRGDYKNEYDFYLKVAEDFHDCLYFVQH